MLDINKQDSLRPKCFFASYALPRHSDDQPPSVKKRPFSAISSDAFYHTIDLVVPKHGLTTFMQSQQHGQRYARVVMKPSNILEGDFFNVFIKAGNIAMRSQGRPGLDTIFSLNEGVLRIETDRPTYERIGLQGVPIASLGRKHVKARYAIEVNLRLPAMLHGHKGFERVVAGISRVFDSALTWLFVDLGEGGREGDGPIAAYQPVWKTLEPVSTIFERVLIPSLTLADDSADDDAAADLLEWITLTLQGSPRVCAGGGIDRYLSRYSVAAAEDDPQDLVRLTWHGFMVAGFVHEVLQRVLRADEHAWLAMSVTSFDGSTLTLMRNESRMLTWQYTG